MEGMNSLKMCFKFVYDVGFVSCTWADFVRFDLRKGLHLF